VLRHVLGSVGLFGLLAGMPAACAKAPPAAAPEPPAALEVPVPPPRVLAPVPPPEVVPSPAEEPPAEPPRPARPRPARPTAPPETKTDTGKVEGPPPEGTTPVEKPSEPAPALRTPQTVNDTAAERRITDVLTRTRRSLGDVARAQLSADAQAQFDTARRFIDQASDALKVRNYMFAAYLADKAEALAKGLAGR
jgi:hypothetical protein